MESSIATATATEPGLTLKVTPPRLPKDRAGRHRLRSDREDLADKSILLVQAPSGFGKTSLLSQWRREWLARGAVVAWLTLDERDDGLRFAQGLNVAMRMASGRPAFDQPVARWTGQNDDELDRLTSWLAAIADMASETVLVLDEAHLPPATTTQQSLLYLMRNAPANLRILAASRGSLNLPVADLAAYGKLITMTAEDLRFSLDETTELLTARFGERIDANASARLHDITEGWPLGLQLAMSALPRDASAIGAAIDSISARTGSIENYFVECLMRQLSPAHADFLVRMSVLELLHPQLCEAVTGQPDAPTNLEFLRRTTPIFIESLNSEWVRIHSLAQQFLRINFDALADSERHQLHERAAAWLAANGLYEQSARHVWQLGEEGHASALAERELYDVIIRGNSGRVLEWFDRLPESQIQARPRLRLAVGWALALSERHQAALKLLGHIPEDIHSDALDRFESALICAGAYFFADQIERAYTVMSQWSDAAPTQLPQLQAIHANQKAVIALYHGVPDQARHHVLHSPVYEGAEFDFIRGFGQWLVGLSYLWEGQPHLAASALRPALEKAEVQLGRRSPVAVLLATALAAAQWDCGSSKDVALILVNRLDAIEKGAAPDAIIMGYLCGARVASLQGEERRAIDLLETLFALGEVRAIPRFCSASLCEQIRLHAQQKRSETCTSLLNRLLAVTLPTDKLAAPLTMLSVEIATGRVALLRGEADRALQALDRATHLAGQLRRGYEDIEIKLLRAVGLRACGDDADLLLSEAISLAEVHGLTRIVADTHPDLSSWVRARNAGAPSATIPPPPVSKRNAPAQVPRVTAAGLLTPKENEVLKLLARNLSNKQIALALGIGDETVKWHLKNLFGKLNAGTRDHLVDRARLLGVIDP
jgi:LuxR family maltose regulon positive regulatory protein